MSTPPSDRPVVLLSNRGPVTFEPGADGSLQSRRGAGGLVSGIGPLIAELGATWIAAAISDGDRAMAERGVVEADGFRVRMLAIEPETYRLAYDEVSNAVLWFAHHGLWDLTRQPAFDHSWDAAWNAYRAVNDAFAEAAAEDAPDGALVLVQDYHLSLVATHLGELRPDLVAVHFSHTPFAPPVWMSALPEGAQRELLAGMAAHRACGFHTGRWADDFSASAHALTDATPTTFVSPLASDPDDIRAAAASAECEAALAELDELAGDRAVIGRVDRVELSKNIVRGFLAYEDLLARHPEHIGRVVFVAGAYPSREGVPGYAEYRELIERTVTGINERFGTPGWTPVVLEVEDDFPRSVALLRRADVLLVNPIRDGLNLVASEGALVNDRHAVLALSPEAGAWERLHPAALKVPPFDVAGTADVLHQALTMPMDERRLRADRLRELAEARTPRHWLADQRAAGG
jgi:trehalose 6-phosphate synthase